MMDIEINSSSAEIKAINTDTVHKICSGQVVLSLAVAVKELVENSLDAGATNIDIRFKNYGIELIEVSDNGSGVTEDNYAALTLKYHTSKLRDYSDLLGVSSFGFRGEALSSLCALSDLIITTRHISAQYATKLEYDHKGNIVKKTPCSRQIGTTVSLSNLFSSLPVRQKEFHKNVKREFNKMTQLLYAYCLISLGVKITCTNQTSANTKTLVVATQGSMSYKDNIACIFGLKQLQSILEIIPEYESNIKDNIFKGLSQEFEIADEQSIEDVELYLSEDSNDANNTESISQVASNDTGSQKSSGYKNIVKPIQFNGFISSCAHGSGRSSTDRQFYFVNSRPCEPTKIIKMINEIYKQYNSNQYPFVFLNVNMERTSVDVNVTPDKRKVFLTREKVILEILKCSLTKLFESIPRTLKIETSSFSGSKSSSDVQPDTDQPRIFNSFLQQFSSKFKSSNEVENSRLEKTYLKRKSSTMIDFVSSKSVKKSNDTSSSFNLQSTENQINGQDQTDIYKINDNLIKDEEISESSNTSHDDIDENKTENEEYLNPELTESCINDKNQEIMYLEYTNKLPHTQIRKIDDIVEKSHTVVCKPKRSNCNMSSENPLKKSKILGVFTDKENLGKHNKKSVNIKTSLEQIKVLADMYHKTKGRNAPDRVKFKSVINPVYNKKCEELSREISKDSFKEMIVVGQFNLGFIITRLDDDLFIIDQHATDEIYNFETLQKTTELTSQKLVVPQQLELTGVNEQILMDNLDIFKRNGFTFDIDDRAPPTKRVKLLTIPMSKNWIFGKEDIEELLFMLRESSSEYCRPSRVRAMFASRACRKSVMIGTALTTTDMKKLVVHMSEIEKPWNCPHGRPTIRHLVNLGMVHTQDKE